MRALAYCVECIQMSGNESVARARGRISLCTLLFGEISRFSSVEFPEGAKIRGKTVPGIDSVIDTLNHEILRRRGSLLS